MFSRIRNFLRTNEPVRFVARLLAVILAGVGVYMRGVVLRSDGWLVLTLPMLWEVGNLLVTKNKKTP